MTVSRINYYGINACVYQCFDAIHCISSNANSGSNTQTTFRVFTSHGLVFSFSNILVSYQSNEFTIFINHRKFLYFISLENISGSFKIGRLVGCYKIFFCHYFINTLVHISFEPKVAIGYNSNKYFIVINNRYSTYFIFSHNSQCITNG